MKGMFLGVVGIGGIGTAAYMGGGSGPNDYVGVVSKSPDAVYAAFSALSPEGTISMASPDGWAARVVQRVTKVPNEQLKLEFLIDDKALLTAEVQLSPAENNGTRVAAELDFDDDLMKRIAKEAGAEEMPSFAFQETMIDYAFGRAMGEMVEQIEAGRPLSSLSATSARWGNGGGTQASGVSPQRPSNTWQQRSAVRPEIDARPAVDPNRAAREHMARQRPGPSSESGW